MIDAYSRCFFMNAGKQNRISAGRFKREIQRTPRHIPFFQPSLDPMNLNLISRRSRLIAVCMLTSRDLFIDHRIRV